jgi:hypothetical protein
MLFSGCPGTGACVSTVLNSAVVPWDTASIRSAASSTSCPPDVFRSLVRRLLAAHGFVRERAIDPAVFGAIGTVEATIGRLHYRYEWTSPFFTQFGYDESGPFRDESPTFDAQGNVLVVVHSDVTGAPRSSESLRDLVAGLQAEGVKQALVLFNASEGESTLIGGWRIAALKPLVQFPQGLGRLAYNVLIATNVFFDFVDQLSWRILNVQ